MIYQLSTPLPNLPPGGTGQASFPQCGTGKGVNWNKMGLMGTKLNTYIIKGLRLTNIIKI